MSVCVRVSVVVLPLLLHFRYWFIHIPTLSQFENVTDIINPAITKNRSQDQFVRLNMILYDGWSQMKVKNKNILKVYSVIKSTDKSTTDKDIWKDIIVLLCNLQVPGEVISKSRTYKPHVFIRNSMRSRLFVFSFYILLVMT